MAGRDEDDRSDSNNGQSVFHVQQGSSQGATRNRPSPQDDRAGSSRKSTRKQGKNKKDYTSSSSSSRELALPSDSDESAQAEPHGSFVDRLKSLTRLQFLEMGFGALFAACAVRVGYWQTVKSGDLAAAAKTERTQDVTIPYRRGAIYDRNGVVLAQSVNITTISTDPTVVRADQVDEIAEAIRERFGGSLDDYREKLTRENTRNVTIIKNADPDLAADLEAEGYAGLYYTDGYQRVYPLKEIGCNVIGCINADNEPASGLELQYDSLLTGTDGSRKRELGISGEVIVGGQDEYVAPVDGLDVRISIDSDMQRVAQETLQETLEQWNCESACAIAIEPSTGEILLCASTPTFDPNHLELLTDSDALSLKSISSAYEPGSVMKPLTMSMAIDQGVTTATTEYWVPATIQVGSSMVGDADERNYDTTMTPTNMLERSSNVGTVMVARQLGAQKFSEYVSAFGFGSSTGVDFPYEDVPYVKSYEEYDGAWEFMSFGQSISVTPIQLVRAIGSIANEGILSNPHFLMIVGDEEVTYDEGERVLSTATAETVSWMMNSVVENGYAYTGAIDGYNVSAKTGTAEEYDATTGTYSTQYCVVSFVGFAPTENPAAVLYVLFNHVDQQYEGSTAGKPWATIMQEVLTKLNVTPSS
jgi:cell division protein FtsI/penicillin-binding protein 2